MVLVKGDTKRKHIALQSMKQASFTSVCIKNLLGRPGDAFVPATLYPYSNNKSSLFPCKLLVTLWSTTDLNTCALLLSALKNLIVLGRSFNRRPQRIRSETGDCCVPTTMTLNNWKKPHVPSTDRLTKQIEDIVFRGHDTSLPVNWNTVNKATVKK